MPIPLPTPKSAAELVTPPADGPTPEFTAMMQDLEARAAGNRANVPTETQAEPLQPLIAPSAVPTPKVEDKPITLKYQFMGNCPTCHQEVSTLELDTDGKHFAVCYCLFCKVQLQSKEVSDLTQKMESIEIVKELEKKNTPKQVNVAKKEVKK